MAPLWKASVLPANEESQTNGACTKTTDVNWTKKHIHRGVGYKTIAVTSPPSSCEPSDEQRGKAGVGSEVWRDISPDQPSRAKDLTACAKNNANPPRHAQPNRGGMPGMEGSFLRPNLILRAIRLGDFFKSKRERTENPIMLVKSRPFRSLKHLSGRTRRPSHRILLGKAGSTDKADAISVTSFEVSRGAYKKDNFSKPSEFLDMCWPVQIALVVHYPVRYRFISSVLGNLLTGWEAPAKIKQLPPKRDEDEGVQKDKEDIPEIVEMIRVCDFEGSIKA
ncbi:hypothetical protein ARMGADRAFT_1064465 [Armillaria gallica]|uniref:Uncharacterized protein n=1 Tax=Armillaria gallica TaxID=47427 RepID=A0A2H3DRD8_ARMGA|nr:hypothetical protein ARMGADRAFT_1064465 [Armillaria gallica]